MEQKRVALSRGKYALVDKEDFLFVSRWKWHCNGKGNYIYAMCHEYVNKIHTRGLLMHRIIMRAPKGMDVDHINGNRLDNRRNNSNYKNYYPKVIRIK